MAVTLMQSVTDKLLSQVNSLVTGEFNLLIDVKRQLSNLRDTVVMIRALLNDAEKRQVDGDAVKLWLKKLEDIAYEAEDVLDDIEYEVLRCKVCSALVWIERAIYCCRCFFSCSNPILFGLKIAHKLKNINLSLSDLTNQANSLGLREQYVATAAAAPLSRETHSYVVDSQVVGREDEISKMVDMLTATSSIQEALSVIPVVGMGGLGKTTFAQCICQNQKVKEQFDNVIMWVCVSDDFEDKRILKEMLESLNKRKCDMTSLDAIFGKLKDEVGDRKFLLVLDDVWNENPAKWNRLKGSLTAINNKVGNHTIVTTRSDKVASIMETIPRFQLGKLPYEICWTIFEQRAFASGGAVRTPELESIGEQIVRKCDGLPLAAAASGGMMSAKKDKEEWLSILNSKIWDESGILPAIRLSFDHLPSAAAKQCFAYCSIFPKDSIMEKDDLIQLWMGQGLLQPPPGRTLEMEDVGEEYIQTLLWNNLLQDAGRDDWNNIKYCKMHDVVHDVAQSLSNARCFTVEASKTNNFSDFRHLNLNHPIETPNTEIKLDSSKLRTLVFTGYPNFGSLIKSESLRCLALNRKDTEELPTSIGKLKHLRYLNLSRSMVNALPYAVTHLFNLPTLKLALPYSVTDLFNLQTLRLGHHEELGTGVAKDFKKLVSLRHLYMGDELEDLDEPVDCQFPQGIGQLTSLQTLPFFTVGQENGQRIEELGSLCNLRGKLLIFKLQNVKGKEEAKSAHLLGKSKILQLGLIWSGDGEGETKNDEEVLEGLQPHQNLKTLTIAGYRGEIIPAWIKTRGMSTLKNLVDICFSDCNRIQEMPTLGRLPYLRKIEIWKLNGIKCIGHEFYDSRENDGNQMQINLFPALKELSISEMYGLEEWLEAELPWGGTVFPVLEELSIGSCPQLRTIPSGCPSLKSVTFRDIGSAIGQSLTFPVLERLWIIEIDGIAELPDWICNLSSLQELDLWDCRSLKFLPDAAAMKRLSNLRKLKIQTCPHLKEACSDRSGSEWSKIAHIAEVNIY